MARSVMYRDLLLEVLDVVDRPVYGLSARALKSTMMCNVQASENADPFSLTYRSQDSNPVF